MTDPKGPREARWYLSLMSPNTKGPQFAWLDPTSIYINSSAFSDLLDDLCADLDADEIDVVAGLDAMGFVLGAALGARLGRGFLPIRKSGKLCVDTDKVTYGNYSGRTQDMEMRTPAFAPGTRVLLADQWVETGGTMDGAVRLIERQGGSWSAEEEAAFKQPTIDMFDRHLYEKGGLVLHTLRGIGYVLKVQD